MMFIDYILDWARARGYAALYGSAHQLNDFMTDTDYAAATDETAVYCHLITAMENVGGHDRADVAVYFARLCDFDFDPDGLLTVQEELKDISKELLQDATDGNEIRYLGDPRWQFGYDDFAENVCWCCLRVTLEDMAGDCVPLAPDAPSYNYDIFPPQIIRPNYTSNGKANPCYTSNQYHVCVAVENYSSNAKYIFYIGSKEPYTWQGMSQGEITESNIASWKSSMQYTNPMTQETEDWLRERIGRTIVTNVYSNLTAGMPSVLAADSSSHYESKEVTVL